MHLKNNTLLQGGKYKIERFIASGGFGCTYEAYHTLLDMRVALKEFFVSDFCNRDEKTGQVSVATKSKVELISKLKKKFMDGRRRCLDNVWIERFWRTIKREYVYINPTDNVKELREGIKNYIEYYNTKRPHQGIEHQIPMTKYAKIAA